MKTEKNKIMKLSISLIVTTFFLLVGINVQAQQYDCSGTAGVPYLITANSGLSMRAEPNLKSNKIQAIPYGKEVMICPEYYGMSDQIEGVDGQWVKAFYRGKEGYMFNGFMEAQKPIEVIIPKSWIGETFPNDKKFYGIYLNEFDETYGDQKFRMNKIDFDIDTVQLAEIPPFYYAKLKENDHPQFLISGIESSRTEGIVGKAFESKFLYPGETVSLTTGSEAHYHIYAKGRVLESKGGDDMNPISMIKNYELHVRRSGHDGDREDQIVYKMDIPSWYMDGYQGGVFIHWMGDLDEDGELDLLLSKSENPECWDIIFFLSSKAEHGHFFKQVTKYQECGGC